MKKNAGIFEPPGLEKATVLRPEVIARLELLRIVTTARPSWDAGLWIKAATELERFVSGKAPERE